MACFDRHVPGRWLWIVLAAAVELSCSLMVNPDALTGKGGTAGAPTRSHGGASATDREISPWARWEGTGGTTTAGAGGATDDPTVR